MNLKASHFLIIESSFAKSKAGLYQNGKLIIKQGGENQKNSDYLLAIINDLINPPSIKTNQKLTAIALSSGPGSFSAMRVGVSIAKALSYSFNLPIIPIGSLKAICQTAINQNNLIINQAFSENKKIVITALMDARVKGIYSATFTIEKKIAEGFLAQGFYYQLKEVLKPELIAVDYLEDFLDQLIAQKDTSGVNFLAGNFLAVYGNEISQSVKTKIIENFAPIEEINSPTIKSMADLALTSDTKDWQNAHNFSINYVRNNIANKPNQN